MALRTTAMLARWAQFNPGTRMPDDLKELPLSQQAALSNADPELHALLGNTANAELELAAMSGSLSDVAPDQKAIEAAANRAEVDRLIAEGAFPAQGYYREDGSYVEPREGNLTAQMRISQLDPQRYQQELQRSRPVQADPHALTEAAAAEVNARLASVERAAGGY